MSLGDKTQIIQPLQTAIDNLESYYKYIVTRHTGSIWGLLSTICLVISMIGVIGDWIDFWSNENLLVQIINAIVFIITLIYKIINFAHHYEDRFTTVETIQKVYDDVEPPSCQWERWDMVDNKKNHDAVYVNMQINAWLMSDAEIGIKRDKNSEKALRTYIKDPERWKKIFKPFLDNNHRNVMYNGGQFYNEKKFGISKEFEPGDKDILVHKTCYYDSYLTNIIPGKQLIYNRDDTSAVDTITELPYQVSTDNQIKTLERIGSKSRANEPGVTTICITSSGNIFLWRQTKMAQSNAGLISASGSGSSDWNDCTAFFEDADGFRKAIISGMERELWEESCGDRRVSKEKFLSEVDTRILGYFRWLKKAGKSEFVGLSRLKDVRLEGFLKAEMSEVKEGFSIDAKNIKSLRQGINHLIKRKGKHKTSGTRNYEIKECSVSCAMALLALSQVCKNYCKECQASCKHTGGKYSKCACTIKPYDAFFDGVLIVKPDSK